MKQFDFVGRKKLFAAISIGIILVGVVFNIIFGTQLDIEFKGGTLLQYSYENDIDENALKDFVASQLPGAECQTINNDISNTNIVSVSLTENIDLDAQEAFQTALSERFPDNNIDLYNSNSLSPSSGRMFFIKCLVAIALASVFLVIYVAVRFRKIGGLSAGVMALLALFNDLLVSYFVFVIFRIPLDDNFVAVVLSILGYSLNGTIVIYDRIRENRRIMDKKTPIAEIVNTSINQSFVRTLNTAICTFTAIAVVAVLALATSMESIVSFAVPMMFGVLSGFYTSTCLASPLWVAWVEHKEKRDAEKAAAAKSAKSRKKKA